MSLSWLKVTAVIVCVGLLSACSSGSKAKHNAGLDGQNNQPMTSGKLTFEPIDLSIITDAELRQCVEDTGYKVNAIQILNCTHRGITSLRGIEQFKDLRVLNVSNNKLTTIDPVAKLSRLSSLEVSNNKLTNLDALAELKHLKKVDASNNQISDISALENTNIKQLYLSNNQISSLAVINSLASLINLTADKNRASIPHNLPTSLQTYQL